MNDLQKIVIVTFAVSGMSIEDTGRAMHYHRNTIRYHLECIGRKTGIDPRNFFDLIKLYDMAIGEHNDGKDDAERSDCVPSADCG